MQNIYMLKVREVKMNVMQIKEAAHGVLAASGWRERAKCLSALMNAALTGEPCRVLARVLICSYYVNLVFSEIEVWQQVSDQGAEDV